MKTKNKNWESSVKKWKNLLKKAEEIEENLQNKIVFSSDYEIYNLWQDLWGQCLSKCGYCKEFASDEVDCDNCPLFLDKICSNEQDFSVVFWQIKRACNEKIPKPEKIIKLVRKMLEAVSSTKNKAKFEKLKKTKLKEVRR